MGPFSCRAMREIFRALPFSVSRSLQHRLMPKIPKDFDFAYERARLKFAPGVTLRVPRSRDVMYDQIALFGTYESHLSTMCKRAGRFGGLMVDVGANVGYFTSIFLAQKRTNRTVAFEPSPRLHAALTENLAANGLLSRASLHQIALSDRSETREFVEPVELTGWGRFGNQGFGIHGRRYQIPCVPCDSMIAPSEKIRFLKIDVEGAESLVVNGAKRILETKQVETVYIEINKPGATSMGLDPSAALVALQRHGYRLQRVGPAKPIEDWIGRSPDS